MQKFKKFYLSFENKLLTLIKEINIDFQSKFLFFFFLNYSFLFGKIGKAWEIILGNKHYEMDFICI